ncbi:MAG: hypothetical protein M1835_002600, partial [Candelina submexicana]
LPRFFLLTCTVTTPIPPSKSLIRRDQIGASPNSHRQGDAKAKYGVVCAAVPTSPECEAEPGDGKCAAADCVNYMAGGTEEQKADEAIR